MSNENDNNNGNNNGNDNNGNISSAIDAFAQIMTAIEGGDITGGVIIVTGNRRFGRVMFGNVVVSQMITALHVMLQEFAERARGGLTEVAVQSAKKDGG